MPNIQQDVYQLQQDVAELRRELRNVSEQQNKFWATIQNMLKRYRAAILRLEVGDSGEKWHTGPNYTRGSRLRIPSCPLVLRTWKEVRSPDPRYVHTDPLATEEIVSGRRDGIPARV